MLQNSNNKTKHNIVPHRTEPHKQIKEPKIYLCIVFLLVDRQLNNIVGNIFGFVQLIYLLR